MSSIQVNNIKNANGTSAIAIDSSGVATFSKTLVPSQSMMFRNRIINGNMVIDQRNAGASVTSGYPVDRWASNFSGSGTFTLQQSSDAPAGFNNSVLITSTSNNTIGASDYHLFNQILEGYNIADWNWGTSNAKTVTLSFWVKSSLTGTYSIQIQSGASTYVFYLTTYTISSANTWEKKTVTISGPTSGGFSSTNGNGFSLRWTLATGSSQTTATSDWATSGVGLGATGQADLSATNGNTFYLTGVQLEVGDAATPFEHRPYGAELALCQRYYEKNYDVNTAPATNTSKGLEQIAGTIDGNQNFYHNIRFAVPKRANPSINFYKSDGTANTWRYDRSGASNQSGTPAVGDNGDSSFYMRIPSTGATWVVATMNGFWTASAEL